MSSRPATEENIPGDTEFLAALPPGTREVIAPNTRAIKLAAQQVSNGVQAHGYLVCTSVPPQVIEELTRNPRAHGGPAIRFFYNADVRKMIIKIQDRHHEIATNHIANLVGHCRITMGLVEELVSLGRATQRDGTYAKRPDASSAPSLDDGRLRHWPTLGVETGASQCLARLRVDAAWWLCRSRGDVRIVLIISVNRTRLGIVIEQWETDRSASHGRYNLRSVDRIVPVKTTTITITRQGGQTTVVGAPLVIPFSDVLLRNPNPPRETDFVFEQAYLENLSEIVWADQNF